MTDPIHLFRKVQTELAKLAIEFGLRWRDARLDRPQQPWISAARELIARDGQRPTLNAVSVRSGVRRETVGAVLFSEPSQAEPHTSAVVINEWAKRYGLGSTLPIKEGKHSLRELCQQLHPSVALKHLLADMVAAGCVNADDDYATLISDEFVSADASNLNIMRIVLHHASSVIHTALNNIYNARTNNPSRNAQRVYWSHYIPKDRQDEVLQELNAVAIEAAERMRAILRSHEDTSANRADCCTITASAHVDTDGKQEL